MAKTRRGKKAKRARRAAPLAPTPEITQSRAPAHRVAMRIPIEVKARKTGGIAVVGKVYEKKGDGTYLIDAADVPVVAKLGLVKTGLRSR